MDDQVAQRCTRGACSSDTHLKGRTVIRVKICAMTDVRDALAAVEFGVDAVGVLVGVLHVAEDCITREKARDIVRAIPPFVSSVLVTHLETADSIIDLSKYIGVTTIQLQGDVTPTEIIRIKQAAPMLKTIKTIHVIGEEALAKAESFIPLVDAIQLDSINLAEDRIGGTGLRHDWTISKRIANACSKPVILSGGLTPENVEEAIRVVRPYAVDVNSGVENPRFARNGSKNLELMKLFITRAKAIL